MLPFFVLSSWFYLEESQRIYQVTQGFWVTVFFFNFFTLSIAYYLSTFFTHSRHKYNYQFAIPLMVLSSLLTIKLIDQFWLPAPMNFYQFSICLVFFTIYSFYLGFNSYLIVKFRANKYTQKESNICYWRFWVDWFSFFWIDILMNVRFIKQTNKKRKQKGKERRREKHLQRKIKKLQQERQAQVSF